MIPGGKLLGMALVSTQKALSLVQEQVAGQRGVLAALLPSATGGAAARQRHSASRPAGADHLLHPAAVGSSSSSSILSARGERQQWVAERVSEFLRLQRSSCMQPQHF